MKPLLTATLAALLCAGCAKINDAGMRLIASSAPALAVFDDTLFTGKVSLMVDRSGTVTLASNATPALQCGGSLRHTATRSGVIHLQCGNGAELTMPFHALGETSGHASGRSANGKTATLTFGLDPDRAAAYLRLPAGKRLVTTEEGVTRLE